MDIIGAITVEMIATIVVIVELIKKILPKMSDTVKIIITLIIGGLVGYSMFTAGLITSLAVAIGLGVIAGGEAAGLWKITHEILKVVKLYAAAAINKKSVDNDAPV